MRVDRRDFLKISGVGGVSALTTAGCNWGSDNKQPDGRLKPSGTLRMEFSGLILLERQAGDTLIHLVDGNALALGPHVPQLSLPVAAVEISATPKPASARSERLAGTEFWVWDLNGVQAAAPTATSGQPQLTFDETPVGSAEKPTNDDGWKSLSWVPDMQTLCGATKIVRRDALAASVTLRHGRVDR